MYQRICLIETYSIVGKPITSEKNQDPQSNLISSLNIYKKYKPCKKLYLSLDKKERYIVHYKNLDFYLKTGMKVTKIHEIISFNQKPWLKEYIDYNTNLRKQSKSEFEKDQYKLMNNAFFGKTMENVKKRLNAKIFTDDDKSKKQMTKPTFKSRTIFSGNLIVVNYKKTSTKLNKPIYLGFCILELSKLIMYKSYYEIFYDKYKENIQLLYQDTDSFIAKIRTEDVYKDLVELKDYMDFSNYEYFDGINGITKDERNAHAKELGRFKDELKGNPIKEFTVTKQKSYAFRAVFEISESKQKDKKQNLKNKGTTKPVNRNEIDIDQMKQSLLNSKMVHNINRRITSDKHNIYVIDQQKISINPFDDKRYYLNKISNIPFGYIPEKKYGMVFF